MQEQTRERTRPWRCHENMARSWQRGSAMASISTLSWFLINFHVSTFVLFWWFVLFSSCLDFFTVNVCFFARQSVGYQILFNIVSTIQRRRANIHTAVRALEHKNIHIIKRKSKVKTATEWGVRASAVFACYRPSDVVESGQDRAALDRLSYWFHAIYQKWVALIFGKHFSHL